VEDIDWCQRPIDRFILSNLESHGLSAAAPATKRKLIRRVTFGLIGLPPTPQQVDAFLSDNSPDAFAKVVDRLLASPHYGEHWGRHWMDVVRYADSNGLDENLAYAHAYRYRDYIIRSFNTDKPFDQFLREQVAGDLLPAAPAESEQERIDRLVATGVYGIGPKMLADDDPRKKELDTIDELIRTFGRGLLGLTLDCARCHDHKFDPISTRDYYALAGMFKSTRLMESFGSLNDTVARWHLNTIATGEQQAQYDRQQEEIHNASKSIEALVADANQQLLQKERLRAPRYLAVASQYVLIDGRAMVDGRVTLGDQAMSRSLAVPHILREAEDYQRGSVAVLHDSWGEGIGIVSQKGDDHSAEYDLDLPAAGRYQLELRKSMD